MIGTTTALTSSPDPSGQGQAGSRSRPRSPRSSRTGTPTGTVTFHLGSPSGTVVGTGTLNASGAGLHHHQLAPGGDRQPPRRLRRRHPLLRLHLAGAGPDASSAPPTKCTGTYPNFSYGNPHFPFILGTNGNDFVYAVGAGLHRSTVMAATTVSVAGDGNNWIGDGNGNDVVIVGNGSNLVSVGNGTDAVTVGNGSNTVSTGSGTDTVSVGNGNHNQVSVGNGI